MLKIMFSVLRVPLSNCICYILVVIICQELLNRYPLIVLIPNDTIEGKPILEKKYVVNVQRSRITHMADDRVIRLVYDC
jgi:hypothetical protein